MRISRILALTSLLTLLPTWAAAVDLSRIERTIAKEPAYTTKSPKYFLVTLGPEAKARVWMVIDGEVLYVDRNGNGDLTEASERVEGTKGVFKIGQLFDPYTKRTHTELVLYVNRRIETSAGTSYIKPFGMSGRVRGKYVVAVVTKPTGEASKAPIIHLDGPLRARRFGGGLPTLYPDRDEKLSVHFFGRGHNAATYVEYDGIPEAIYPKAEITFPGKSPGAKPIKRTYILKQRC